jgi:hypothetical protein
MPSPIIPVSHYELCISHFDNEEIRKKIIASLKPQSLTLFEYITAFLREVSKHSALNGTTVDQLCQLFAYAILRPEPNRKISTGIFNFFKSPVPGKLSQV